MSKRIGLFFGSFNPVHVGHLSIGEYFYRSRGLDIWYILSPQNPFKRDAELAPAEIRLKMLLTAASSQSFAQVNQIEMSMPAPHYTANTLFRLSEEYPEFEFIIIMGEDNRASLQEWYQGKWILKHYEILSYPRIPSENLEKETSIPLIEVSSSDIRERVKTGKSINGLVPSGVEKIIREKKLYLT